MRFTLYQIDAFTDKLFKGNPAAVVPLEEWLPEDVMQALAMENNLSETVFFVPSDRGSDFDYDIRWFTPAAEINLCGHATLASAHVLYTMTGFDKSEVRFNSKSGLLIVRKEKDVYAMDFPSWKPAPFPDYPRELDRALNGINIIGVHKYRDLLVELASEQEVKNCDPDFTLLKQIGDKVIITAAGESCDFVSRFFAPALGINEDPVTGSAHAQLIPFWSEKLKKKKMFARQLSKRGGDLWCEQMSERVSIGGKCAYYMKGEFDL